MSLIFILGIGIMLLGIAALRSCKYIKKLEKCPALVQECRESCVQKQAEDTLYYEVTFEIQTPNGVIYRTVEDNQMYNVGECVEIFYDWKSDTIKLTKNVSPTDSEGSYIIIGFGIILSVAAMLCILGKRTEPLNNGILAFLVYFVVMTILFAGILSAFLTPGRRKKSFDKCRKVEGNIVEVKKRSSSSGGLSYRPTYAFYQDGEEIRIESEVSFGGVKFCPIGKKVTIVINDMTGEKYCLEDMKQMKVNGYLVMFSGFVLCAFVICIDFFYPFGN